MKSSSSSANAATISDRYPTKMTNSIVGEIDNIRQKRLGSGDIIVSEMALGTQRWVSGDYNSPDENLCFEFMDRAILKSGINLIDTAEQYPIPSTDSKPEGLVETTIGKWLKKSPGRREKVVIATKITGGRIINKKSIALRCENSLRRLGTDYIDIYQLHWPAR
jgi:aryl-alcohol dehydrogenase-like predicted oxidoreductase